MLVLQLGYVWHLFSANAEWVQAAANVGSHFIINNILQASFILLWVRSRFWIAELMLILNFLNLTVLYYRHHRTPLLVHCPVVSMPLAFTYVALFWNGAAMVNAHSLAARIVANVAVWTFVSYGAFFVIFFGDWSMGLSLTVLSLCKSRTNPPRHCTTR